MDVAPPFTQLSMDVHPAITETAGDHLNVFLKVELMRIFHDSIIPSLSMWTLLQLWKHQAKIPSTNHINRHFIMIKPCNLFLLFCGFSLPRKCRTSVWPAAQSIATVPGKVAENSAAVVVCAGLAAWISNRSIIWLVVCPASFVWTIRGYTQLIPTHFFVTFNCLGDPRGTLHSFWNK